jgi:hypothetical protein
VENIGLDFEYGYDNDAAGSCLVLKINNDTKLLNHQVEILCQNPNSSFVPFHIKRENENVFICYNITSKISLSQYIERKSLKKKELLDLLRNIVKNLMLHGNYLLDLSGFIIHSDFIFVNPATAEVSLLYVPVPCSRNSKEILRSFFKDIVVNSSSNDDDARDNYLQRILNYLKSDTFSLIEFNRLIVDLRNSGELCEYEKRTADREAAAEMDTPCGKSLEERAYAEVGKSKSIRSIILLQPFFLIAVVIAYLLMAVRGTGDIISISAVVLIAAALDILAIKKIMDWEWKRVPVEDTHLTAQDKAKGGTGCRDKSIRSRYKQVISLPDVVKANDTILISEVPKDCNPYLESIGSNRVERIVINKNKFLIGRLGSMVDHIIQGNTIGKLHAEIKVNEGLFYIKDLNSKNGTYVNGVRISGNNECEIKENDIIRFSNYEYVFRNQRAE